MKIMHYTKATAEHVEQEGAKGVTMRWAISRQDGAPHFSMRVFDVEPGGCTPLHDHPWEHEVFVLEGKGVVVHGQEESPIASGDVALIPPGERHQFRNSSGQVLRFICLIPNPA